VEDDGSPDGLTVDGEGGIWTAIANQGVVHRYTLQGRLDEVIEVPATKVTSCTFGGEALDQLFITTSKEDVDTSTDRNAGSLFRADVGVRGLPVLEFAG
jgi:sugar lactone lactonase YvrE